MERIVILLFVSRPISPPPPPIVTQRILGRKDKDGERFADGYTHVQTVGKTNGYGQRTDGQGNVLRTRHAKKFLHMAGPKQGHA